ncbi:alpha-2-macroglobulin family protein [Fulvimarina sp. MAC8]|uniref:alpha-2-macroglobulin family protein n=1 Tax=Fulvimarina sp. MAC8 TaxID=3162874 RepID=UPI0032EB793D
MLLLVPQDREAMAMRSGGFLVGVFGFFVLLLAPSASMAQDASERRVVVTEGADYFGADYDVLQDVDLDLCTAACLGDAQCKAFTLNTRSNWCFLKSDAGELRTVEGAISGKLVEAVTISETDAAAREVNLTFVERSAIDQARRFRLSLAGADPHIDAVGLSAAELVDRARNAVESPKAISDYQEALKRAPLDGEAWAAVAKEAIEYEPQDWQQRQANQQLRLDAAINAYLTAPGETESAEALDLLARAYEGAQNWRSAIKTYRESLALQEAGPVRDRLDTVLDQHGFRITDNSVDNNAASPRICLQFSDPLSGKLTRSENVGDYLVIEGGETLPVSASGAQICVDGVKHGERYRIVARPAIESEDGETLRKSVDTSVYVRDRDPFARFETRAYVLPRGGEAQIPVVTVNTDEIEARLQRIGERALTRATSDAQFLRQLANYQINTIAEETGEDVWTGTVAVQSKTNEEVTTAIPVSAMVDDLKPGVYVLSALPKNVKSEPDARATLGFVVSVIGLTTIAAETGFHVIARSLGGANPASGVTLKLVAQNNQILGEAVTDESGHARFSKGLIAGTGGDRPALLTAEKPASGEEAADFVFLDMTQSAFDLTDRGVDGRAPAGPVDVFVTPDRGIYRTGEIAHFTGLMRDSKGAALERLSLTAITTRPDGVEHERTLVRDQGAGGFVYDLELPDGAMRGLWKVALHTDPKKTALAESSVLVEDFLPEKIDFELKSEATAFDPANPAPVSIDARYLFGAPASDLNVGGEAVVTSSASIDAYPGYVFGLADDDPTVLRLPFEEATTDADGEATLNLSSFDPPSTTKPLSASLVARVIDTDGRPVERDVDLPVAGASARIGIKPRFDGTVPDDAEAGFDVIAIDADNRRAEATDIQWVLNRIETDFQWYVSGGRWNYEPVERSTRIASGEATISADDVMSLNLPVEWGQYELNVTDPSGAALPASVSFEAGWAIASTSLDTPEAARVLLDKPSYEVGDTAKVHIEPRFAGTAEILVMDERVIARTTAEIDADGGDVSLDVTEEWGAGAYVMAIIYRPMDLAAKRMPGRAIGLAHAKVEPGERSLEVSLSAPAETEPRRTVAVDVKVNGVEEGETAYLTVAAVDTGILNITGFEPPSLSDHYFGKRRLGAEVRDLYSKLIDRMQGAPGAVRSGGDASGGYESPPPMDDLVSLFSGHVQVGPDDRAKVEFDVPDFNGELTVMALAWTKSGVGEANTKILVRDPLVMAVSRPLFLAPGDLSRIAVDVTHVEGPTGTVKLALEGGGEIVQLGMSGSEIGAKEDVEIGEGERKRMSVPIRAGEIGTADLLLTAELPGGERLEKRFSLDVRSNAPEEVDKSRVTLAANGGGLSLDPNLFADFVPGTASATVSITGAAEFDVAGVVRALDLYPYGCTEQITSRAMPLVYLDATILAAGLGRTEDVKERVDAAISGVLANQAANGAFGLWGPGSGDLWLDSYVTDFLTRAREAGYSVPDEAFMLALDNLRNNLAYLPDRPDFGPVAYAYYVLARNGRAAVGDLRYFADNELTNFPALAKGQMAAALAFYGDRTRAESVFRAAIEDATDAATDPARYSTYGSSLRDGAAVLTLGLESGVDGFDVSPLVQQVNAGRLSQRYTSTQEDAWSLLAAHALLDRQPPQLTVAGRNVDGPFAETYEARDLMRGLDVANRGAQPITAEVTLRGTPTIAPPASVDGYEIRRNAYTLEGEPANPAEIGQGDRLVFVVEVTPIDQGPARLMIDDPLPAGFEIDNPSILRGGDVAALDWLEITDRAEHTEFHADRFLAAVDQGDNDTAVRRFAYIVRAVSPGEFVRPAALVQNMYDPSRRGRTDETRVSVIGPLR